MFMIFDNWSLICSSVCQWFSLFFGCLRRCIMDIYNFCIHVLLIFNDICRFCQFLVPGDMFMDFTYFWSCLIDFLLIVHICIFRVWGDDMFMFVDTLLMFVGLILGEILMNFIDLCWFVIDLINVSKLFNICRVGPNWLFGSYFATWLSFFIFCWSTLDQLLDQLLSHKFHFNIRGNSYFIFSPFPQNPYLIFKLSFFFPTKSTRLSAGFPHQFLVCQVRFASLYAWCSCVLDWFLKTFWGLGGWCGLKRS